MYVFGIVHLCWGGNIPGDKMAADVLAPCVSRSSVAMISHV